MHSLKIALLILLCALPINAQNKPEDKTIATKTAGAQKIDGYVPLYWDAANGKMWMEISRFNTEMLYQVSLPAGVGSNPIGLDRGQLGGTYVVYFERVGPKVLMVQPNYRYRALSNDEAERRAVADSFARSVIWGFKVEAAEGDRVLVDATAFFLRDAHGVAERLRGSRQGNFRFDESRSAFYLPRTKGFPKNTEIETVITLAGEEPGGLLRGVAPTANSVTVRQHHSFVELPDGGYKPRAYDPRVSAMQMMFYDYASPFNTPIEQRWIRRHRLQKRDPNAAISEVVKPIVYYVDNGVPEPIRTALVEGASWWAQAFEAAGFKNAFRVEVLPADADPMDARYNMINWVHRSTRGWSYGASVSDPRTGEIIKGNVSLGSLRIRQDVLLGTGMIPPLTAQNGMESQCEAGDSPETDYLAVASTSDPATDSAAMALARIRQLSAHEVGHTLGFSHNFAASSYGRASVMDYPAPWVEIKNGKLDLSNAYAVGIGEYDKFSVKFAYAEFASEANEKTELESIVQKGIADGMLFIDDGDGRGVSTAHPLASVWDNGSDAIAGLRHEMEVRRIGLKNFGLNSIATGQPLSALEAKLLPLYLHHRYQLVAAAKSVGGLYFSYAIKTTNGPSPAKFREIVPAARQREALKAILETIKVEELAIPQNILDLIPPVATGFEGGTAEYFSRRTDPSFDPLAAATIAADLALGALLDPNRAARMIDFHAQNPANPDFKEALDAIIAATWPEVRKAPAPQNAYHRVIQRSVQSLTAQRLMDLASNENASPLVRAEATAALRGLNATLKATANADAHRRATQEDIERFLNRPDAVRQATRPLPTPPGDPIGGRQ
jgi:hypothetical protein